MQKFKNQNNIYSQEHIKNTLKSDALNKANNAVQDNINSLEHLHETVLRAKEQLLQRKSSESSNLRQKLLLDKISKEVYSNLLFTNTTNSIIKEIKSEVEKKLNVNLQLQYNFLSQTIRVLQKKEHEIFEITGKQKVEILNLFWDITSEKINEITLSIPPYSLGEHYEYKTNL